MSKAIVSESKTVLKNILIGIGTSVLGASIIYFLGFNRKGSYTKAEQEEIAIEGWNTYTTTENIYVKNRVSLLSDVTKLVDFGQAHRESKEESEKLQTSLADLSEKGGLNNEMVKVLKKRSENEKKEWPKTEALFKDLAVIDAKKNKEGWSRQQTSDAVSLRVSLFMEDFKSMLNSEAGNIEQLAATLAKKYNKTFDPDKFLIVQARKYKRDIFNFSQGSTPGVKESEGGQTDAGGMNADAVAGESVIATQQYMIGKWDGGSAIVTLNKDGKANWLVPADNVEAKGTWQLKEQQLIIKIKKHPVTGKEVIWTFDLSNTMTNSFTITNTISPYTVYHLARSNQ